MSITQIDIEKLTSAAKSQKTVKGLTHDFYRYPARFSPSFARAAIDTFSNPGELVLDPFMGGGTTILEAIVSGRDAVGTDINSLSVFITKVKASLLPKTKQDSVLRWIEKCTRELGFRSAANERFLKDERTRNLSISRAKFIKKYVGCLLAQLESLPSDNSRDFARCVVLRTSQWALDGRKKQTTIPEFKKKLIQNATSMISGQNELRSHRKKFPSTGFKLFESSAAALHENRELQRRNADLIVCSPPYPGVHVLYHRWQVDGRKESPAPYWIADCNDGHAEPYYTFGRRQQKFLTDYFENAHQTFSSIRKVTNRGAYLVQMVAFTKPQSHLKRYLQAMEKAGFTEVGLDLSSKRIWRSVPNRKWHANLKGNTSSAREVVLIHKAA